MMNEVQNSIEEIDGTFFDRRLHGDTTALGHVDEIEVWGRCTGLKLRFVTEKRKNCYQMNIKTSGSTM